MNLIVGPQETGSSVGFAAAGRHFDSTTANGAAVRIGELLEGLTEGQVRVETVAIRDATGKLVSREQVNEEVTKHVQRAVGERRRVLLHVLDTSKTGLIVPSLETVAQLRERCGESIDVVVDACQLRLERSTIAAYLALGCIVLVTGSKFYTGPPFAGALLVPGQIARRARQ